MSLYDDKYLSIAKDILENGYFDNNRTGVKTYKLPHQIMQFNLEKEYRRKLNRSYTGVRRNLCESYLVATNRSALRAFIALRLSPFLQIGRSYAANNSSL